MKILIVDDEPAVRLSLKRVLSRSGHEVLEAHDGIEGLKLWREHWPNVVILDVLMPGLSGPAVLKELGPQNRSKVMLMSAYAGDYDLQKVQAMGAHQFVAKPFADIFSVAKMVEGMK